MKRVIAISILLVIGLNPFNGANAALPSLFLDFDSPATGGDLDVAPLNTPLGTISFIGELRDKDSDVDFDAAGAFGDVLDIDNFTSEAELNFDFDVLSFTFIYGGNFGSFDMVAYDLNGQVVDSFYQASTEDGQPAGPQTLTGEGIRRILWQDYPYSFAAIDNVTITVIPEPTTFTLLGLGSLALVIRRRGR